MEDLKIIENDLIPVYETSTGEKVVYGSELYFVLGSKTDFSTWIKRRFDDCQAVKNEDYSTFPKIGEQVSGTKHLIEYIIKLDIAKEIAMLERSEKGKQVRKYFIDIEKKYQQKQIDTSKLSPELQVLSQMISVMASQELKLNQLEVKTDKVEDKTNKIAETMQIVADTFAITTTENFNKWVNDSMDKVANSDHFDYAGVTRYSVAKRESYKRLQEKAHCDLKILLKNAIARAKKAGATIAQQNAISTLSVIASNIKLKEIYTGVVKEMMIAYCVEIAWYVN